MRTYIAPAWTTDPIEGVPRGAADPFGLPYRDPGKVAERLSLDRHTAVLDHDGVLVLGRSLLDAFDRLEVLETTAEAYGDALSLGAVQMLTREAKQELYDRFVKPVSREPVERSC